jgi:hypothetical protein
MWKIVVAGVLAIDGVVNLLVAVGGIHYPFSWAGAAVAFVLAVAEGAAAYVLVTD